jgi:hypothetical protein
MDIQYQHCDLVTLLDMLTDETRKYTKAIKEGLEEEIYRQSLTINMIIAEIKKRRKDTKGSGQEISKPGHRE